MSERVPRLGDVLDDYCPRCRLLLNHDVASLGVSPFATSATQDAAQEAAQDLVGAAQDPQTPDSEERSGIDSRGAAGGLGGAAQHPPASIAKVTCRTCHNTHDYRHAQVPPKRKSSKQTDKKTLMDQVLAGMGRPLGVAPAPAPAPVAAPAEPVPEPNTTPISADRKKRDLWADYQRIQTKDGKKS
jgi:hypothetical protein